MAIALLVKKRTLKQGLFKLCSKSDKNGRWTKMSKEAFRPSRTDLILLEFFDS